MMLDFRIEHLPVNDIGARVTGAAQTVGDLVLPGMLEGRILCSPHAHAVIRNIDTARALALPGVIAILTPADRDDAVCRALTGAARAASVLTGKARFVGDWIAAVAAETGIIAEEALSLLYIDYAILPASLDPHLASDAEAPLVHEDVPGNIAFEAAHPLSTGHANDAFEKAAFAADFSGVESRPLRRDLHQQVAVASFDADGVLAVTTSSLKVSASLSIEAVAAGLAQVCGQPVRVTEPDTASLYAQQTSGFHSVRVAADESGNLIALDHRVVADAGAYCSEEDALTIDPGLSGVLKCAAIDGAMTAIYTHTPPTGGLSAPGNPGGSFTFQQAIDRLSEKVGMDPLEFRIRNLVDGVAGARMAKCMRGGAKRFGWSEKWHGWGRKRAGDGRYLSGVGMCILSRFDGNRLFAHQADFAEVEVDTETGFVVLLRHVCALDVTDFRGLPDPAKLQASLLQGIGTALIESFVLDPRTGAMPTQGAMALRAPTTMDTPDPDYVFTGTPLSADAAGGYEPAVPGFSDPAPAIANAIYDAAGVRIPALPLSADRILRSLRGTGAVAPLRSRVRGQYL